MSEAAQWVEELAGEASAGEPTPEPEAAAGEQTAEESAEDTDQPPEKAQTTDPEESEEASEAAKTVPYDRFSEVNSEKNQYKTRAEQLEAEIRQLKEQSEKPQQPAQNLPEGVSEQDIQQLKDVLRLAGIDPDATTKQVKELQAKIQEQEAEKRRQAEEAAVQAVAERYSGKKGEPAFEKEKVLDTAREILSDSQKFYEAAHLLASRDKLIDWAASQARKSKPTTATKTKATEKTGTDSYAAAVAKARETGNVADVDAALDAYLSGSEQL